ncbi:MAG: FAD-dependent oxidoreductase, partial [bacterium]
MSDNAIVVGAGVGGLACAALLAHGGYKVTVFEKNLFIGGACSSYQKKGYTFDRGVHMFTSGLNGPFGVVLKRLGLDNLDFFKNINARTGMKVYGMEGCFPFDINIEQLFKLMKPLSGKKDGAVSGEGRVDSITGGLKGMGFSSESFKALTNLVSNVLSMSEKEIDRLYEDGFTVTQYLNGFTEDPFIHGVFAFLIAGMFAISPKKASAAEFVHCFKAEMTSKDGYQYPKGGGAQA